MVRYYSKSARLPHDRWLRYNLVMGEHSDAPGTQQPQVPAEKPAPRWVVALVVGSFFIVFGLVVAGTTFGVFRAVSIGALFLYFGILLLGAAAYTCVETLRFVRSALSTDGVVVGFEERLEEQEEGEGNYSIEIGPISWSFGKPARRVSYFPRVEFESQDHEKRVFTSDDGSRKPSYHVGQAVRVLYDPARPQVARINKHPWGVVVAIAMFGACFLVPGLWLLLVGFGFLPDNIHWG
ncbi:MAG TPA: DUF3592 domain-containing protein [Terrimicrobiaceae bacterium]|nr:DUF3592 domain-containing protein [Terrimicrobiaceae bacterium]